MTTSFRLLLCAAALVAAAVPLRGQGPGPAKGRLLLLDNERVVEGDIERVGGQYRVRRPLGETWVPGDRALGLFADIQEAYTFLSRRANLDDADERLRLARWCHGQGMNDKALENVREAVRLRPDHAAGKRLLGSLERIAARPPAPARPVTAAATAGPPEPEKSPDVSAESLGLFATKVQPILMNACAGCHAADRAGAFKLTRAYDYSVASRRSVQTNLAAVLAQVNLGQPQASPLLTKALTAHGDVPKAPLSGKQVVAYRTLEDWVEKTLAGNPHLREQAAPAPAETKAVAAPPAPPPEPSPGGKFASGKAPEVPAGPVDPFDPVLFNRAAHPASGGR